MADIDDLRKQFSDVDANDLRKVLATVEGQRLLWGLLEDCRVYSHGFSTDPLLMAFESGKRSIGIGLIQRVMAIDPGLYDRARMEAKREYSRRERLLTEQTLANREGVV